MSGRGLNGAPHLAVTGVSPPLFLFPLVKTPTKVAVHKSSIKNMSKRTSNRIKSKGISSSESSEVVSPRGRPTTLERNAAIITGSTVSHMIHSSGSTAVDNLNLNLEASIQRLTVVEEENRILHQAISRVVSESRMVLESSIVDLQTDFNQKISQLSEKLQSMYDEETSLNPSKLRPRGLFNRKLFYHVAS